jgi:hypothetical protein
MGRLICQRLQRFAHLAKLPIPLRDTFSAVKTFLQRLIHCVGSELLHVRNNAGIDVERDRHRRLPFAPPLQQIEASSR